VSQAENPGGFKHLCTSYCNIPAEWEAESRKRDSNIIIDRIKARTSAQLARMTDRRAERNDRYGVRDIEDS